MVEFKIKIHPQQRLTRIPKILTQTFGFVWSLHPDTKAAVICPEDSDLEEVIKSVEIILLDLRLQVGSNLERMETLQLSNIQRTANPREEQAEGECVREA